MIKKLFAVAGLLLMVFSSGCSVISPDSTGISLTVSPLASLRQAALSAPGPAPDLIIESITWVPLDPSQADAVTISVTVKNQGDAQALPSRINFYIDGYLKNYLDIPNIVAGATLTRDFNWAALAGSHAIKAVVDEDNWITESDDFNNDRTVTIVTLAPDLLFQSVVWSPLIPREGDNVTFTVTVKNQGSGRAESSRVAFFVDDTNLLQISLEPIEPAEMATGNFSWFAQTGITTVKLVADPYNRLVESDESNNEYIVDFPRLVPDLIIQTLTWEPLTPSLGATVNFTVSIGNWGTAGADPFRLHYFIGNSVSGFLDVPGIPAGGTVSRVFSWAAQAGSQDVKVVADPFDAITESNEANNERTVTFAGAILPDLLIQDITWWPLEPSPGETVTFNVTARNLGNGQSPGFSITLYVDDNRLASSAINSINPGFAVNADFVWDAQPGTHVIKAVVDSSKQVVESNEANNELTVIYPVAADLAVSSIAWLPEKPQTGDNITFIVTVTNQGDGQAASFSITQYIDDVYLAFVLADPIDAGAAGNVTFSWIGPAGLHSMKVVIDPHAKVLESNENNNQAKVIFNIYLTTVATDQPDKESAPPAGTPSESAPSVVIDADKLTPGGSNLILWLAILPLAGLGFSFYLLIKSRRRD